MLCYKNSLHWAGYKGQLFLDYYMKRIAKITYPTKNSTINIIFIKVAIIVPFSVLLSFSHITISHTIKMANIPHIPIIIILYSSFLYSGSKIQINSESRAMARRFSS